MRAGVVFAVVFLQPAAGRLEELTFLEREGQAEIRRTAIGLARAQEKGFQRACPLARGLGCAIPAGSRAGVLAAGGLGARGPAATNYAARRRRRKGLVISWNHGCCWMVLASCFMRK